MDSPKLKKHKELKPEELRWKCDHDILKFTSTSDIEPMEDILGQERALKALKLGVELRSPGYNIYIAGLSGSGKATSVKQILETISSTCPELYDYAYVNNFQDTDRPTLLMFPKGNAKLFKAALRSTIEVLRQKIPQALESDGYIQKKKGIVSEFNRMEEELMSSFDNELRKEGLSLGQVKVGEIARPDIIPVIENDQVPIFQLEQKIKEGKITQDQAKGIIQKYNENQEELQLLFKKGLKISQEFQKKSDELEKECVGDVVKALIDNLKDNYTQ